MEVRVLDQDVNFSPDLVQNSIVSDVLDCSVSQQSYVLLSDLRLEQIIDVIVIPETVDKNLAVVKSIPILIVLKS